LSPANVKRKLQASLGIELKAADLHVHSMLSHDVLSSVDNQVESLYSRGREMGLDYIVITDHDRMDAYDMLGRREGLISAAEFTFPLRYDYKKVTKRGKRLHTIHSNVYCLDRQNFQHLSGAASKGDMKRFVRYCRRRKLPYTFNHPFWIEGGEKEPESRLVYNVAKNFPVIEWNMHQTWEQNVTSMLIAARLRKGIVATTDAHIGDIGRAFTIAPGRDFREFFHNAAIGNAYLVPQNLTDEYLTEETLKFIDGMFDSKVSISENAIVTETKSLNSVIVYITNHLKHMPFSGVVKYAAKMAVNAGVSVKWRVREYSKLGQRMMDHFKRYK
jgi:predicted metal-dependent phosphoesterase TrpH